jgi:hypothetical protein
MKPALIRKVLDGLIYASVALGALLLAQLYFMAPRWLMLFVGLGWVLYLVAAVLALMGKELAYPLSMVLSALSLALSLRNPVHWSFLAYGAALPAFTFLAGNGVQLALLLLAPIYLLSRKRAAS